MIAMYKVVTGKERWTKPGKPYLLDGVPFILKSHRLPINLSIEKRRNVVYTHRHGKDAVLAYSKFLHNKYYYKEGNVGAYSTEWLKHCIIGLRIAKRWEEHMNAFYALVDEPRCVTCFIRFEDMLVDPVRELKRVMRFAGFGDPEKVTFDMIKQFVAKEPNDKEVELGPTCANPSKGFLTGSEHLIHGESTANERTAAFTRRWERFKYWTTEIDDLVNEQIGDTLEKYGYEK